MDFAFLQAKGPLFFAKVGICVTDFKYLPIILNKKYIDASVKERPQTLIVPSEEICKRVFMQ